MKKMTTAILLFDLMAGMLFLGFYGLGSGGGTAAGGGGREEDCHNLRWGVYN